MLLLSSNESESLIENDPESDSDFSLSSFSTISGQKLRQQQLLQRPPSPEPLWLQKDPAEIPQIELPTSSDDLLVPKNLILKTISIYEILRRFKNLVRLSPFRLEDFCASLLCEEQSQLLTEIHIMLLKAILREEDSQATHFGPLDQKDSVNISLYLIDNITWSEVLRIFVESDSSFDRDVLKILTTTEYPYTTIDNRLTVLKFLTDQFLITTPVRDDLLQEGPIHYDDHCRICHRLGDLLCCETCPAVFHLDCVEPPLVDVPTEDWQCNICNIHKLSGVNDCITSLEKQGLLCRYEHLGYDRLGRKYWFINRRLFVETENGDNIWYYSNVKKLNQLIERLDKDNMEQILYREINDMRDEIVRQMTITETLTNQFKGNRKSYFEYENTLNEKTDGEENSGGSGGEDESKMDKDDDEEENEEETTTTTTSTVVTTMTSTTTTTTTTSGAGGESDFEIDVENVNNNKNTTVTRSKTGSLTPKLMFDQQQALKSNKVNNNNNSRLEHRLTRNTITQIKKGTIYFKLGMENSFKTYVNQYTINAVALNKPQRNEERDKKRHLSHKFSLTTASEFKWLGNNNIGTVANTITTLRQTLVALEQSIGISYMHPNWLNLKKTWIHAIAKCEKPKDFAKVLVIYQSCVKTVVFANVWNEQLGHIRLHRITSLEREEKKKLEKREKRERDDEEERNRLAYNFVKYSLGLKHQVWKQKGEEYRIHGQWGWLWMSYNRRRIPNVNYNGRHCVVADKRMAKVENLGQEKIIMLDDKVYKHLKNSERGQVDCQMKILDVEEKFDRIDVSRALTTTSGRLLYPKIAKKSKLDDFLLRRKQLKEIEEKKHASGDGVPVTLDIEKELEVPEIATHHMKASSSCVEKQLLKMVGVNSNLLKIQAPPQTQPAAATQISKQNIEMMNIIAKRIHTVRLQFGEVNRLGKMYACYSKCCNITSVNLIPSTSTCYSPLCVQKSKIKRELLILLRKAQALNGGKKPISILEQKLTESNNGQNNIIDNDQTNDKNEAEDVNGLMEEARHKDNATLGGVGDLITGCDLESDKLEVIHYDKDIKDALKNSYEFDQSIILSCIIHKSDDEEVKSNGDSEKQTKMDTDADKNEKEIKEETKQEGDEEASKTDVKLKVEEEPDLKPATDVADATVKSDDIVMESEVEIETEPEATKPIVDETFKSPQAKKPKTEEEPAREVSIIKPRMSTRGRPPKSNKQVTTITTTHTTTVTTSTTKTVTRFGNDDNETLATIKLREQQLRDEVTNGQISRFKLRPNRRFNQTPQKAVKKEEVKIEPEMSADGSIKVYSANETRSRIYLKRIKTEINANTTVATINNKKLKPTQYKYPIVANFATNNQKKSIMVLPRFELKKLSRNGGKLVVSGYHNLAKTNQLVWPYPCSRPLFKTCWLYRTMNVRTLASIGLQLRIMWACLRWDDMATKAPTHDGKHQVTTETEIMSLELLKHRFVGKFMEKTQYLRRKVVIPLELPKTIRGLCLC